MEIDFDEKDDCEIFLIYELNDCDICTISAREFKLQYVRPAIREYLNLTLSNHSNKSSVTDIMKYNILKSAIEKVDETNNVELTVEKSKIKYEIEQDYERAMRELQGSSIVNGSDIDVDAVALGSSSDDDDNDNDDSSEESEENEDDEEESHDDSPRIKVKVFVVHANVTRGFAVSKKRGYKVISKQLEKDYSECGLQLSYIDDDGDEITIKARNDFEYAFESVYKKKKNLSPGIANSMSPRPKVLKLNASMKPSNKSTTFAHSTINFDNTNGSDDQIVWQKGELLGAGSFGRVYSAIDQRTGRKIAVKEINLSTGGGDDKKIYEQAISIQREVEVLSALDHTNIVKYYGTEYLDDIIRIFLEIATDGSIKDVLNEFGPLAETVIRRYTRDIVSGLAFLHDNGVIHRDIKPSNLLVHSGIIKLADFGCAGYLRRDTDGSFMLRSGHGTIAGTTIYMSPEMMKLGNSFTPKKSDTDSKFGEEFEASCSPRRSYGRKTDIWSLGITLVEMATAKPPFRNAAAAIYSVCVKREFPIFPLEMSDEATIFLSRCLVESTHERGSARELLREPFLNQTPHESPSSSKSTHRSPSVIYSSTSLNSLPPLITRTATAPLKSNTITLPSLNSDDKTSTDRDIESSRAIQEISIPNDSLDDDDDMMFFTAVGRAPLLNRFDSKALDDNHKRSLGHGRMSNQDLLLSNRDLHTESYEESIKTSTGVMTGRSFMTERARK